jgi:hypothetical protein
MTSLRIRSFCKLWFLEDGEWEKDYVQTAYIYEPLNINPPADARPYCCLIDTVIFYKDGAELTRTTHHALGGACNTLILLGDTWYEIASGQCLHRNGHWCMRWLAYKNTRRAAMMNAGWGTYKE